MKSEDLSPIVSASANAGRAKLLEIALSIEDSETAKNTLEEARKASAIDPDHSFTRSVLSLLNWASVVALVVGVVLLLIGASRVTVA